MQAQESIKFLGEPHLPTPHHLPRPHHYRQSGLRLVPAAVAAIAVSCRSRGRNLTGYCLGTFGTSVYPSDLCTSLKAPLALS